MATVKTPFRYPGAKNKLLPILMPHIDQMLAQEDDPAFCDAFVGGGSVLLEVASKYPSIPLFANDKDYGVASFWELISSTRDRVDELLLLIDQKPTIELFYQLREEKTEDPLRRAYHAIFFNRTCFSGINKPRSNPIGGRDQKSKWTVDCRYNAKKIKEKIVRAHQLLVGRTTVENKDIAEYDILTGSNIPAYLDPPYYVKGGMLYSEFMQPAEHQALANILNCRPNWVLSYDDATDIRNWYANHQIIDLAARYSINGRKKNWANKQELVIVRK
jgi:DNA adenine methylase